MKVHAAVTFVPVLVLVFAGASRAEPFNSKATQAFLSNCKKTYVQAVKSEKAQVAKADTVCSCALKQVEQTMSAEEFRTADEASRKNRKGQSLSETERQKLQLYRQVQSQIAQQCVEERQSSL